MPGGVLRDAILSDELINGFLAAGKNGSRISGTAVHNLKSLVDDFLQNSQSHIDSIQNHASASTTQFSVAGGGGVGGGVRVHGRLSGAHHASSFATTATESGGDETASIQNSSASGDVSMTNSDSDANSNNANSHTQTNTVNTRTNAASQEQSQRFREFDSELQKASPAAANLSLTFREAFGRGSRSMEKFEWDLPQYNEEGLVGGN
jgi:hypothetical protein